MRQPWSILAATCYLEQKAARPPPSPRQRRKRCAGSPRGPGSWSNLAAPTSPRRCLLLLSWKRLKTRRFHPPPCFARRCANTEPDQLTRLERGDTGTPAQGKGAQRNSTASTDGTSAVSLSLPVKMELISGAQTPSAGGLQDRPAVPRVSSFPLLLRTSWPQQQQAVSCGTRAAPSGGAVPVRHTPRGGWVITRRMPGAQERARHPDSSGIVPIAAAYSPAISFSVLKVNYLL